MDTTAVILTLNEEKHIASCIDSLRWADDVVVFDSNSTDDTVEIAHQAGATVIQHTFVNYADQRNAAMDSTQADWILFVDADERVTPELAAEIRAIPQACEEAGWWIPRRNIIFGHQMQGAGWWPDHQLRLLHRKNAHYDPSRGVHELVELTGSAGYLKAPFVHFNYDTLSQFVNKQTRYLSYDVDILRMKGTSARFYTPVKQGLEHFRWRFITLQGWRDGIYGFVLSTLMGYYEMRKYQMLRRS